MEEKLSRSQLEYDYLKFSGEMVHFDVTNPNHRQIVTHFLSKKGYKQKKFGDDWVYYENIDCGMKAFFSNYPMNNKKIGKKPSLTLEFTGHYFIRDNADLLARDIVKFFSERFGTFFKVNRVDIRQDIYDARYPFDYFPDWRKDENNLVWALRSQPKFDMYSHDLSNKFTGFCISTSRYKIKSYNRNIAIHDRFRKGEVTKSYYDYYKKLYGKKQVQRLEIQLIQDACNLFTIMFFRGDYDKDKVLRFTMANFGRNHALKYREFGKQLSKMETNQTFKELFYLQDKDSLKVFKKEFQEKAGIKISNICFSTTGRSINEIIKMLGKKICEEAQGNDQTRQQILANSITILRKRTTEFKDVINDRIENCKNTFASMAMNLEQLMYARSAILMNGEVTGT